MGAFRGAAENGFKVFDVAGDVVGHEHTEQTDEDRDQPHGDGGDQDLEGVGLNLCRPGVHRADEDIFRFTDQVDLFGEHGKPDARFRIVKAVADRLNDGSAFGIDVFEELDAVFAFEDAVEGFFHVTVDQGGVVDGIRFTDQ